MLGRLKCDGGRLRLSGVIRQTMNRHWQAVKKSLPELDWLREVTFVEPMVCAIVHVAACWPSHCAFSVAPKMRTAPS